jgi:hypothetical protein
MRKMTRKEFLQSSAGLIGVALVIACTGDDEDDGSADDGGECPAASIGGNHGHAITPEVTVDDMEAGEDVDYELSGPHAHSFTVSPAHWTKLMEDGQVSVSATGGDHSHLIELTCS